MKKIASISLLASLATFTAASIVMGTVAWFSNKAKITPKDDPIEAVTQGAYFAYGDGSAEHPYGITKPRHLYNLSWLQYLNYFNKKKDNEGKIIPVYFELGDDVDGEGMAIPPIGDSTHPFVHNFDGNGYIISNFVISNNTSDYQTQPPATSYVASEIVGLFGVVGVLASDTTTSYYTATNQITDTGISNLTIKSNTANTLIGMVAGYVNGPITNVAVDNCTINVGHTNQQGNPDAAAISGIGTTNLSDYSIVGYATTGYKSDLTKVDETIYDVNVSRKEFTAKDGGSTSGWGGSIAIKDIHERLNDIRTTYSKSVTVGLSYDYVYNADGSLRSKNVATYGNNYNSVNMEKSLYVYNANNYKSGTSYNNKLGSFQWGTNDSQFHYLSGGHYSTKEYYTYYTHTGYPITDGTNYLCYDGTSLVNSTDANSCTLWNFESSGSYYYITTNYNNSKIYLDYNSGNLSVSGSTGSSRRWKYTIIDGTKKDIYYNGDSNYHLTYNNGWTIINTSGSPYYIIHDGTHYIAAASRYHALSTTSASSALHFSFTNNRYQSVSNTSYYLGYYSDSYPVQVWSDGDSYYRLVDSSGNLISENKGEGYLRTWNKDGSSAYRTTKYVTYSGSDSSKPWSYSNNISGATKMYVDYIDPSSFTVVILNSSESANPHAGPDSYNDSTKKTSGMDYSENDVTYFPLNVYDADEGSNKKYEPNDNNTGYVIGGSTFTSRNASSVDNYYGYGNVRISSYYSLSDSIRNYNSTSHKLEGVWTYDGTLHTINDSSNSFKKYADSKTSVESVLKECEGGNVYGLHFMDAEISKNNVVTASYASINNVPKTNYQMPANSIDFQLKEKGYINFFAGTYGKTGGNDQTIDSFFSIHQLIRSGNNVSDIREIEEVLSDGNNLHSYVYKLKNLGYTTPYSWDPRNVETKYVLDTTYSITDTAHGGYSDGEYHTTATAPTGYSTVFETDWIKNHSYASTSDAFHDAFYFEIPMNMGEYCLGSVSGKTYGAYLVYLDIGANALTLDRTTFKEHFIKVEQTYEYPLGVALKELPARVENAPIPAITVNDTDTALAKIQPTYGGNLTLDRNLAGTDVTITRTDTSVNSKAKPCYASDNITLYHDSGGNEGIDIVPKSIVQVETYRLQYYDYNVNTGGTIRTVITDTITTTNGGTPSTVRTIQQFDTNGNAVADDKIAVYNTEVAGVNEGSKLTTTQLKNMNIQSNNSTVVLSIHFVLPHGVTDTDVITLTVSPYQTAYYSTSGYTVVITPSSGTVTITVITYNGSLSYVVKVNGETISSNGQTVPNS